MSNFKCQISNQIQMSKCPPSHPVEERDPGVYFDVHI